MKDTSKQSSNYRRVVKNIADEIRQRHAEEFKSLLAKMKKLGAEISLFPCDEPDKMQVDMRMDGFFYSKRIGGVAELLPFIDGGIDSLQEEIKKHKKFQDRLESLSCEEVVALARELGKKLKTARFQQRFTRFLEKRGCRWDDYEWLAEELVRIYSFKEREELYRKALSTEKEFFTNDFHDTKNLYVFEEKDDYVRIDQASSEKTGKIRELALHYKDMKEKK